MQKLYNSKRKFIGFGQRVLFGSIAILARIAAGNAKSDDHDHKDVIIYATTIACV